jgi:hypothetical protein
VWRVDLLRLPNGERPFATWLWSVPDPPVRREIVAAIDGVLRHDGPHVAGTRWGGICSRDLFEFRIRRRDGASAATSVFCTSPGPRHVVLLSACDARLELRARRIQTVRQAHAFVAASKAAGDWVLGDDYFRDLGAGRGSREPGAEIDGDGIGGGVRPALDYAVGGIIGSGHEGIPRWPIRTTPDDGLAALSQRVDDEAAAESREAAAGFRMRCLGHWLGREMAHIRCELGLTQREAAALAGLQQRDVSRLECARDGVSFEQMLRLGAALGAAAVGVVTTT